jgi:hypothetical protein
MQKKNEKATQASARDQAGEKKRETGDPESLCQAAAQMAGYRHGIFVADG